MPLAVGRGCVWRCWAPEHIAATRRARGGHLPRHRAARA